MVAHPSFRKPAKGWGTHGMVGIGRRPAPGVNGRGIISDCAFLQERERTECRSSTRSTTGEVMNDDSKSNILLLHSAEYTALTNRNIAYVAASFSVFPLLVLFVALVAPLPISMTEKVQYTNCRYMECVLKPMVVKLLGQSSFWKYEEYKTPMRKKAKVIGDLWCGILVSVFFLIASLWNWPLKHSSHDTYHPWLFILDFLGLVAVGFMVSVAYKERQKWFKDSQMLLVKWELMENEAPPK
jgi:hypothetical protein